MSSIDERIVSMKFDNAQFQKGTADTMTSIENLKQSLKFDGVAGNIANIAASVKGVSFQTMADGVDTLASKFSGLQAIALGALATIGSKVVDLGLTMARNIGNSLTASIQEGFADYNRKLTSVQTIMNATGASIDTVSGYFNQLDTYADKTIYNLDDMTSAFAKFTNAGVDMSKSVPAIKGIANMVALAGQDAGAAQIAMYNLSQSIAGGFLTTTDYKSLNLANVATKEWKDQMIQGAIAAGTLKKVGGDAYHIVGNKAGTASSAAQLFNENLADGWATSQVLLDVLGKYGDATTDIGKKAYGAAQNVKSLPMMLDTLKAAAGTGWTDTFQIVLGNVEEATKMWTGLTNVIGGFIDAGAKARNGQLQIWKDMGGRQALLEAFSNAWTAINKILGPIGKAFREVFPPSWGNTLAQISFFLRDLTKGLIISDAASQNLYAIAKTLFSLLKIGTTIIGGIFAVVGNGVGMVFRLAGALLSVITPLVTFVRSLFPASDGAKTATDSIGGFFDMLIKFENFLSGPVIGAIATFGKAVQNFLGSGQLQENWKRNAAALIGFGQAVASVYNILFRGDFTSNPLFSEDSKLTDMLFKVRDAVIKVIDWFKNLFSTVKNGFPLMWDNITSGFKDFSANIDWDTVLSAINTGLLAAVAVAIFKAIRSITKAFDGVSGMLGGIKDALGGLGDVLGAWQKSLQADALMKLGVAIVLLAAGIAILASINPDRLVGAVTAMAASVGILLGAMALMSKMDIQPSLKLSAGLILLSTSIRIMAESLAILGKLSWEQLTRGLVGVALAMGILVAAAQVMSQLEGGIVKAAFGMILMAGAITAMAGAVAIFGNMPLDVLIQGGIAVATTLALLTGAAVILSKFAPQMVLSSLGLMAMAAALNMLVLPITLLGLLPIPILTQGMVTLGILIAGLVIAANMLAEIAPSMAIAALGMMAMAAAVNMLVAPITLLGVIPFPVLIQGLLGVAATIAILVIAANAMTGAIVGAGAMLVMAAAILVLSVAIAVLGAIPVQNIIVALLALVAALVIMGVSSALLAPIAPIMFVVAAAVAVFAVGMVLLAAAVMIGTIALAMLGPALMLATNGLMYFAANSVPIINSVPAMLAVGAALIVFGAGALVAGAGIAVLAAGIMLLGIGLAIVGATGIIGATALAAIAKRVADLVQYAIPLGVMAATFTVLGAGVTVLGAGLLVLGAGALLTAIALAMLVPLGALVALSLGLIMTAVKNTAPMAPQMSALASSLKDVGSAIAKVGSGGAAAAGGIAAATAGLSMLTVASGNAGRGVQTMASTIQSAIPAAAGSTTILSTAFSTMATSTLKSVDSIKKGMSDAVPGVSASAKQMAQSVTSTVSSTISASSGTMYNTGYSIGTYITDGMRNGINAGNNKVTSAAASVAANALRASKRELGIASPSKEYFKVGGWSTEGMANGMIAGSSAVTKASKNIAAAGLAAMTDAMLEIQDVMDSGVDLSPTISPVLDLTGITSGVNAMSDMLQAPTLTVDNAYLSALAASQAVDNTNTAVADASQTGGVTYIQNNYSPKALSDAEIYRNTKNQLSVEKGKVTT